MKRLLLVAVVIMLLIPIFVFAQDDGESDDAIDCETYTANLESEISNLNIRLSSFANTETSLWSDYVAFQEKRITWQEIEPPDCAVPIHADVISMYANIGDIYAAGQWLQQDPASNSGKRIAGESITRAEDSIITVTEELAEISGLEADTEGISDSFADMLDRMTNQ